MNRRKRDALWTRGAMYAPAFILLASCTSVELPQLGQQGADSTQLNSVHWPAPPEKARYRLSAVLLGEETVVGKGADSNVLVDVMRTIAGISAVEPKSKDLKRPTSGLTLDDGSVLVADSGLKAVIRFDFARKQYLVWDKSGANRGFKSPVAVVQDGQGGFLVSDSELARIVRLDKDGRPSGEFGGKDLVRPTGLARDPGSGAIFVADTARHVIQKFSPSGALLATIGGPGDALGRFNAPTYLSFANGRLFVSDTLNFRIQSFDANGGAPRTFGKAGLYVGQFARPKGVAVGGDGRVYVVESRYDHLLVFDDKGQLMLPIEGRGAVGPFNLPAGVWTDSKQNVYVADMFNGRIIVLKELTRITEG